MASLRQQKRKNVQDLFESLGVRSGDRWRTEAEDHIVSLVLTMTMDMSGPRVRDLSNLLNWVAVHAKGESRSSLMAMCERGTACQSDKSNRP
jgi:hypothetical protein